MKKNLNIIHFIVIGVAIFYSVIRGLLFKSVELGLTIRILLLILQNIFFGLAIFSIAVIVYNILRSKIQSDILTKVLSVLISFSLIYFIQVFILLLQGATDLNLFNFLKFQFIPDFNSYKGIMEIDVWNILDRLGYVFYYIATVFKYYLAALLFFVFIRKPINTMEPNPLNVDPINNGIDPLYTQAPTEPLSQTSTNPLPTFCPHCGAPVTGTGKFCSVCGKPLVAETVKPNYTQSNTYYPGLQPDVPSTGFNVLAFFVPMVGLILFAVWSSQFPKKAKAIGKWALIGFISSIVSVFLFYALFFSFYMSLFSSYS